MSNRADHGPTVYDAQIAPRTSAFNEQLRTLRKAAGLSQREVAVRMGLKSQQATGRLERSGEPLSMRSITAFAAACGYEAHLKFTKRWTAAQCAKLNEWQAWDYAHPFTCADSGHGALVAKPEGWVCSTCGYTQTWAHDFMFEGAPLNPLDPLSDGALGRQDDPSRALRITQKDGAQ